MGAQDNRRKCERQALDPPGLGYLLTEDPGHKSGTAVIDPPLNLYVDVLNTCRGGAAVQTPRPIEPDTAVSLLTYNEGEKLWYVSQGEVKWTISVSGPFNNFLAGLEIKKHGEAGEKLSLAAECTEILNPSDFEFINRTQLLASLPREALCSILNCLTYREIKAGERFINQGDPGDMLYIVQEGSCVACVEKDQTTHTVGCLGKGDVVGEMGMLTGEPRSAHVEAETDMKLWGLSRRQFDAIAGENPDLRCFLTELVADRFSGRKLTAERTIGKYTITDIIGRGGYSIVYKGVHSGLNMPVAIKMMRHNLAMDPDFLSNFQKEAIIIANLNHENIIKVYDIETLFRTVFIVMELVEGETIKELIQRQKTIPYPLIVSVLIQICRALTFAHQQGIIHRDVKPSNIFIQGGDRVKLLDFGLSCTTGSEDHDFSGTVAFMSPEEIEGESVDQRSDIYALGITAYEMLTGRRPFPEDDILALFDMHLEQDIPDPAEIRPGIPERLRQLVLKACARKPEQRYQTVDRVMEELLPLVEELRLTPNLPTVNKRGVTTLHLIYEEEQRPALRQLMEDFSARAQEIGVELRTADFPEI
jgi:predicted Ser/Thr protein kinase